MMFGKRKVITLSSGYKLRPAKGKCPECRAPEKEYCKKGCTFVDGFNPADR
jgi:hypothetical protein